MTVETSERKQSFTGGQGSLTFTFRTLVSNPEYIKVLVKNVSTAAETPLTYATDYSVAVNSDGVGGVVTVSPTYSTAYNYVVYRETVAVQPSDYDDFNQFPADTIERDLDRRAMIDQELQEEQARSLRYPISAPTNASVTLPDPEADSYLGWNSTGTALENKELPDPSILTKASNSEATTGTNDTAYMTPAKVKLQVENSGSVSIPYANLTGIPTTSTTTIVSAAWPVGSVFIGVVSTNPGTLLGIGTWTAFAEGRMLIGFGASPFNSVLATGGAQTINLQHNHSGVTGGVSFGSGTGSNTAGALDTTHNHSISNDLSTAQSVMNPYIVVYMWQRTA